MHSSGELQSLNLVQNPVFLISSSRPSERDAVDTAGVDLFVIYRGRLCDLPPISGHGHALRGARSTEWNVRVGVFISQTLLLIWVLSFATCFSPSFFWVYSFSVLSWQLFSPGKFVFIQYVSVIAWVFDFRKFIIITDVSLQAMYIACAPIASICSKHGLTHERLTKYLIPWGVD